MLQFVLAFAPVEALANDAGLEKAASFALVSDGANMILSGDDPPADPLDRDFEPGKFLTALRQADLPVPTSSFAAFADAISFAGGCEHFYRVRAPPYAAFS